MLILSETSAPSMKYLKRQEQSGQISTPKLLTTFEDIFGDNIHELYLRYGS